MSPMDTPKHQKPLHAGHRQRMRTRFLCTGLDGFADHEVLELLLFYAIPRQDVNPMAHELLNKFGTLPAVLDAPINELCTVRGVGPKIAQFLTLIPDVLVQTEHCILHAARAPLRNPKDLPAIILKRKEHPTPGDTYVILLDSQLTVLAVYPYASFDELNVREIASRCLALNSRQLVLAECMADPDTLLSNKKISALLNLQDVLATLGFRLVDFYRFDQDCLTPRSAAAIGLLLPR